MKCYKTIITATALALSTSVNAATFNFYQGGFTDGAFISGTFTFEDMDLDGQLSSFNGELLDFSMSFSGNSLVSAFSIDFIDADVNNIVYDLNEGVFLGDGALNFPLSEGINTVKNISEMAYVAGAALGDSCLIGGVCGLVANGIGGDSTLEYVTVSAVPVPAAVWLFGSGLISLLGLAKRRKA